MEAVFLITEPGVRDLPADKAPLHTGSSLVPTPVIPARVDLPCPCQACMSPLMLRAACYLPFTHTCTRTHTYDNLQ